MADVASAALPRGRSAAGSLLAAVPSLRRLAARVLPLIREHAVSAAAFAAIDWGCWDAGRVPGLIVTGISVLLLDFTVRG